MKLVALRTFLILVVQSVRYIHRPHNNTPSAGFDKYVVTMPFMLVCLCKPDYITGSYTISKLIVQVKQPQIRTWVERCCIAAPPCTGNKYLGRHISFSNLYRKFTILSSHSSKHYMQC